MSTDNTDDKDVVNPLNMSDEDYLNNSHEFDLPDEEEEEDKDTDDSSPEQGKTDEEDNTSGKEDDSSEEDDDDTSEDTQEDASDEDVDEDTDEAGETGEGDKDTDEDDGDESEDDSEDSSEDDKDVPKDADKKEPESSEIDYKVEYEKLLAPFRANGRDMSVNSVEESRTLMSMGANYVKKMTLLKPNLKYMKMLDNNGLLNEDTISFMIDLQKKNPAAVQKFMKDSKIDPMDINIQAESNYVKNATHVVDDKEVELDGILEDIQDTESFQDTLDIIGKKWDSESRSIIVNEPAVIKVLNDQVANGIFKKISEVVERERTLGRLVGVSDIAAYKQVGDQLAAQGVFNPVTEKVEPTTVSKPATVVKKLVDDSKLKSRKKAASSTKSSSSSKKMDLNPLSMSDADFEAMDEKLLNYK